MNLRVTPQVQTANAIAYMQRQASMLEKYQRQIASGVKVQRPSDDPLQFSVIAELKQTASRSDSHLRNIAEASSVLNTSVNALLEVQNILSQASRIAIQGADATVDDDQAQTALATEVDALIDRALQVVNQQMDGRYLFSGAAYDVRPFRVAATDPEGRPTSIVYDGSAEPARVMTGPNATTDTRYAGDAIFLQPGRNLFQTLLQLRDDLRSNLPHTQKAILLNQRLADIENVRNVIHETIGEQSARLAQLESWQERLTDVQYQANVEVGQRESTDYAEAIVKLREHEQILQAAMAVTARLFRPSLLEFIR